MRVPIVNSIDKKKEVATVIIPVFNAPWKVDCAIRSAIQSRNHTMFSIVVHDDGSDDFTKKLVNQFSGCSDKLTIHSRKENIGLIKTINQALKGCKTRYAIIVKSDVILTDGLIDQLVKIADADESIASVSPLTNKTTNIEIKVPPGVNFIEVNRFLQRQICGPIDVVSGIEFCVLLRMKAFYEIGYFEKDYSKRNWADSGLYMRLTSRGWRTVIAPRAYVYHVGSVSFRDKHQQYLMNNRVSDARWKKEHKIQCRMFKKSKLFEPIRTMLFPPLRWAPLAHARQVYRYTLIAIRERNSTRIIKELIKGALRLPVAKIPIVTSRHIAAFKSCSRLSVTYILPQVALTGGVISVLQLVNELIMIGVDARLATLHVHPEMEEWPQYTGTMVFRSFKDMQKDLPDTDIVVATHWTTAEVADNLSKSGKAGTVVYFVQDFEPWFYSENDKNIYRAEHTYRLLPNKIVKSNWLSTMLAPFGGKIFKIRLGMNLQIFYPRNSIRPDANCAPVLLAMARPSVPHRGYNTLIAGLGMVKKIRPDVRIQFFGGHLNRAAIPFDYEDMGVIMKRDALAGAYSEADIFIDASDFQGFGRPALEAMACGVACILTGLGGVTEYAQDRINSLIIPPKDPAALCAAVQHLLEDDRMRRRLGCEGRKTAGNYCHKREARETLSLFEQLTSKSARQAFL